MRQNTPHPKELKAKAHKLFGTKSKVVEGKSVSGDSTEGSDGGGSFRPERRDLEACYYADSNLEPETNAGFQEEHSEQEEEEEEDDVSTIKLFPDASATNSPPE